MFHLQKSHSDFQDLFSSTIGFHLLGTRSQDKRALALSHPSLLNRLLTMCSELKELFQGRETQKLRKTCTTLLDSTSKVIFHQP